MAIPAALAAAAPALSKVAPTLLQNAPAFTSFLSGQGLLSGGQAGGLLNNIKGLGSSLGNIVNKLGISGGLSGLLNKGVDAGTRLAYTNYLTGIGDKMASALEARADKYDQKLQDQFNEAEPQYQQEAGTQLPELTQLVQDIANQSAEAQRQNQRQINASLAQQGVRGGQAAILANRATGELNRNLQRDINQTVYDEAANRQNSRLNYYSNKALTPWSAMSNAYGQSMVGANNALSQAQGGIYSNAYDQAMKMKTGQDAASVAKAGAARNYNFYSK